MSLQIRYAALKKISFEGIYPPERLKFMEAEKLEIMTSK